MVEQHQTSPVSSSSSLLGRKEQRHHRMCTRVLECKMKLESLRKESKRLTGLAEVLVEQEKQWNADDEFKYEYDGDGDSFSYSYDDTAIAAV